MPISAEGLPLSNRQLKSLRVSAGGLPLGVGSGGAEVRVEARFFIYVHKYLITSGLTHF
jgi:hypothetical protein